MLSVGRYQVLLCNGKHGKTRGREGLGPSRERIKEIWQERRIQHDVPGNVADDGVVETPYPERAQNRFAVTEKIPGKAYSRREIVVIAIVDGTYIGLKNHARRAKAPRLL